MSLPSERQLLQMEMYTLLHFFLSLMSYAYTGKLKLVIHQGHVSSVGVCSALSSQCTYLRCCPSSVILLLFFFLQIKLQYKCKTITQSQSSTLTLCESLLPGQMMSSQAYVCCFQLWAVRRHAELIWCCWGFTGLKAALCCHRLSRG